MKRTRLKSKEVNRELAHYQVDFSKKDSVELLEEGDSKMLIVNQDPAFFYCEERAVPTLKYLQEHDVLKKIVVDMGAIKFMVNGADVMRPGIVGIDEGFSKGDFVLVVDVNNKKPLAVGVALFDSEKMEEKKDGKVIKNIHHVGDEVWKAR